MSTLDIEKYRAAIEASGEATLEYNRINDEIAKLRAQRVEVTQLICSRLANIAALLPQKDMRESAIYILSQKNLPAHWLQLGFHITEEEYQEILARGEREEYGQRLEMLSTMPYLDYLRTPEWQVRRGRILERDGYHCQVCYSTEYLNVHHRTYERRGNEDDSDLITLCRNCHYIFHENGRLARVDE